MKKTRSVIWPLLTTTIALSSFSGASAGLSPRTDTGAQISSMPAATLWAVSEATILFAPENDLPGMAKSSPDSEVPCLVLRRNGELTDPDERTLVMAVEGIRVAPGGATVTVHVETQREDPDLPSASDAGPVDPAARSEEGRIPVWHEARWIGNASGVTETMTSVFTHTFAETMMLGDESVPTPTDYFRFDVTVATGHDATGSHRDGPDGTRFRFLHASGDYAFLMENQYIAGLPQVPEATDGAAPDELIVYYLDMVPFGQDASDRNTWIARDDIVDYVGYELVPLMAEAFRIQSEDWGFLWYDAWTSFRPLEGAERLSVALSDGQTWFHGRAPRRGHAAISIRVSGGNMGYDTLTEGLISNFRHELFHNLQRNINQHSGGDGNVDGAENAWQFISEGTAVMASSVSPVSELSSWGEPAYMLHANPFIGYSALFTDLNRSYAEIIPYRAAIYWRFLYEQCATCDDGTLDPAAGMAVIRRALTVLYSGDVVDISTSTDLVCALPEIMDRALAGSSCPFHTHAESLAGFACALYALQLDGGRCASPGRPSGCGLCDPHNHYFAPPVSTVSYSEANQGYAGRIPSSFGVDLVDVVLDPGLDGQPLEIEFRADSGSASAFIVQVWEVRSLPQGTNPPQIATTVSGPRTLAREGPDGELSTVIAAVDGPGPNVLGLIIVRADTNERVEPEGAYTIMVRPAGLGDTGAADQSPEQPVEPSASPVAVRSSAPDQTALARLEPSARQSIAPNRPSAPRQRKEQSTQRFRP